MEQGVSVGLVVQVEVEQFGVGLGQQAQHARGVARACGRHQRLAGLLNVGRHRR